MNDKPVSPGTTRKRGRPKGSTADKHVEPEAAYRKRAETAPMILTEGPWKETITEVVYWPGEGYGGGTRCETREQAEASARQTMMLGYGRKPDQCRVRIIETRTRVIEVRISNVES